MAIADEADLRELFDAATQNPEVEREWRALSDRQRRAIRDKVSAHADALQESARQETQRYRELQVKLDSDLRQIESGLPHAPRWLTYTLDKGAFLFGLAILGVVAYVVVNIFQAGWPTWRDLPNRPWLWGPIAAAVAIGILLFVLLPLIGRRYERQTDDARASGRAALRIEETEQRIVEAKRAILQAIRDNGMLAFIRAEIGRIAPAFATKMPIAAAPGLVGSKQESLEIETPAHRELRDILELWDRGSIGLAGPRGAGKSTLIRTLCRDKWADEKQSGSLLGIIASAPVEYQARDFLLHLFLLACHRVQEWELEQRTARRSFRGPRDNYDRLDWKRRVTMSRRGSLQTGLRLIRSLTLYAGVLGIYCLLGAIVLAYYSIPQSSAHTSPPAGAASAATSAAALPASQVSSVARVSSGATARASAPTGSAVQGAATSATATPLPAATSAPLSGPERSASSPLAFILGQLGINAASLFSTGIWLTILAFAGFATRSRLVSPGFRREMEDRPATSDDHDLQAVRDARHWLAEIKFQHSFSAGWGGGIKLPIGFESSATLGRSLAQAPLTLPEIVDGFTRFLTQVKNDFNCKIVIGIDELDKLADTDKAQRFLNEIKAIFDVDGVFYLVSVSEDAMSQFERRGLPFRDAFDSAFDKVVAADYLRFEDARRLIDERVLGVPIPFQALCYCLAGGLARELVRNCRDLVKLTAASAREQPLADLAGALIRRHLNLKRKAMSHAVALVGVEPHRSALLMKLHRLRSVPPTAGALLDARADLAASVASVGGLVDAPADRLSALAEEMACYVYYLATLAEFFSEALDEGAMRQAMQLDEKEVSWIDSLASILQSLSLSPALASSMLDAHRLTAQYRGT
jgi:hypothetical protein